MRIECPHCGATFEVQIEGEISNMMVFPCAACKAPLMYFHGEISELDREEFANLRKRLSKVIDAAMRQNGMPDAAVQTLKNMVEESQARADERESKAARPDGSVNETLSDDVLNQLERDLDELDVDSFLDKL